ncbi:hypothetical protein WME90_11835 [Sorangium sp. So ce375]|uniref:hypothetical protein n=1 Tax=Sorangium sp. So ce375 TaxID=3133306 RepID=UPI003F5C023E
MIAPSRPSHVRAAVLAARPRSSAALARSLAAAALAVSTAGCLVISPPEYEHPEQTAPVLTAVYPPPHIPVFIGEQSGNFKVFGATVLSEDNGTPLTAVLYIDYGRRSSGRLPFPFRRITIPREFPPGTIAGGQRLIELTWDENAPMPSEGKTPEEKECHTITMIASHAFNDCSCPDDPDDKSTLTWQIIHCDPNEPTCPKSCPALDCETTPCVFCDDPSLKDGCTGG